MRNPCGRWVTEVLPSAASLSACPMPTRSASQADNDKYNEKNISFSAFTPQLSQGDFPP
ncbi:MAG: hypothetical protein JTT16_00145 [Candidatus Brockarchaeota archaeon]|nr:hypothetical protein [Candidatus Brockarchaeota archaeon]MBO3767718.1 hypothetical protein [Candidatus Brockarchaeota archaeon]